MSLQHQDTHRRLTGECSHVFSHIFSKSNKTTWISIGGILVYFGIGMAVYSPVEEWNVGDAFYFAVVILSTVGYGDFLPSSDGMKMFTAFYILFALIVAAFCFSNISDALASLAAHQVTQQSKIGIFDVQQQARLRRKRFALHMSLFFLFLVLGTLVNGYGIDWGVDEHGSKLVNGFYLTVVTLTTVGFGDLTPDSPSSKVFVVLLMLVGIPIFGAALGSFTAMLFGDQKDAISLKLIKGGITRDKFAGIQDFCEKLAKEDIGNVADDNKVSRFEFLCFLLVQNGVVEMDNIKNAMSNFKEVDVTNSGFIEMQDVESWVAKNGSGGQSSV